MIEMGDEDVPVHPAATVVLVRDSRQGLEALLVQRNSALRHMGGMWVFPGGRVDPADFAQDSGDEYTAAVNAAIRETREEAGLTIDAQQLHFFSHWTTPEGAKRRYSTWFFLALLEDGQEVIVDGQEIAHHRWVRPEVALAELADSTHPFTLTPPTYVSLVDLLDCQRCTDAHSRVTTRDAFYFAPRMVSVEGGICFLYEGDAGYDAASLDCGGTQHRTYMIDNKLEYICQC
tara:strand:- start:229898 stop:230593 length:696 start_codon:yes stop_codon:yes gene_type:complete